MRSSVDFTPSLHIKMEWQNCRENSQFLLNSLTEKVLRRLQLPFEGSKWSYLNSLQDLGALRKSLGSVRNIKGLILLKCWRELIISSEGACK